MSLKKLKSDLGIWLRRSLCWDVEIFKIKYVDVVGNIIVEEVAVDLEGEEMDLMERSRQ